MLAMRAKAKGILMSAAAAAAGIEGDEEFMSDTCTGRPSARGETCKVTVNLLTVTPARYTEAVLVTAANGSAKADLVGTVT
jgi:hypothetical protein